MRAGRTHYKGEANTTYDVSGTYESIPSETEAGTFEAGSEYDTSAYGVRDYTTYPREFITYRWYRPLVTGALTTVFFVVLFYAVINTILKAGGGDMNAVTNLVNGGYDTMDVYTGTGALISLGGIAILIPALAIANKIAGRRTFRSYESSRGGWNFGIFFKMLLICLVFTAVPIVVYLFKTGGKTGEVRFTTIGLALCLLLGPMQCIAEEFVFRGFLMQTFGAWFKLPVLAILLQTVVFVSQHPYDIYGMTEVAFCGLIYGLAAWLTHGLEAGSAQHICNNLTIFLTSGFGFGAISSESDLASTLFSIALDIVFLIIILILRKRGMFDDVKCDDAAMYNAKVEAKRAGKAAKRAARAGR